MFHHPVYPSHPSRENPELRRGWVPIFDKHHVDLVLQGHDHAYLRTYPMRGDSPRATAREGTVYVVSVAGESSMTRLQREYIEVGLTGTPTYQTIEIDDVENRLTYRAWTDNGRLPTAWSSQSRHSPSDLSSLGGSTGGSLDRRCWISPALTAHELRWTNATRLVDDATVLTTAVVLAALVIAGGAVLGLLPPFGSCGPRTQPIPEKPRTLRNRSRGRTVLSRHQAAPAPGTCPKTSPTASKSRPQATSDNTSRQQVQAAGTSHAAGQPHHWQFIVRAAPSVGLSPMLKSPFSHSTLLSVGMARFRGR